jgi:hypothetical protein
MQLRSGPILAVILLAAASTAHAAVLHVPAQYPTIQDGVDAAQAGDSVMVAAGTFSDLVQPPGTDTTKCVVAMKPDISLIGAGIGQTFIDPDSLGRGIYCQEVPTGHIEGFTITRAFAEAFGAAIYCLQGSSPTISDCELTGCGDGGLICNFGSSPEVIDCLINGNSGKQGGGVECQNNSGPTLRRCVITGNEAPLGGGFYIRGGTALLEDCQINDNQLNTSAGSGGGLDIDTAEVTLRRCEVHGNVSSGIGGGIGLNNATLIIEDSTVLDNSATGGSGNGGGIYAEFADVVMERCAVAGNSCPGNNAEGGGLYLFFALGPGSSIRNSTIADNATHVGGVGAGIYAYDANPLIENTIIAFNQNGKGLHCEGSSAFSVECSDLFGNSGGDLICGSDLGGNFSADPLFCDLANLDLTLHVDSPCLDNQHPGGVPCGQIGAYGLGTCDGIGVPEEEHAVQPPVRLIAAPNPFGRSTTIQFGLASAARVWLAIYDVGGRTIRVLEDRVLEAGLHERVWDGRDAAGQAMPSGIYFYQLGGDLRQTAGRIVLTR